MSTGLSYVFAIAFAVLTVIAGPAAYAADTNAPTSGKEVKGDGKFKYAQLAVWGDRSGGIHRSTGVKKIMKPGTGVYCIKPSKNWNTQKYVGIAAVEWGSSTGNDLMAVWNASAGACPNSDRWFEVRTYSLSGGNWIESDRVSWTFYVP